MIRTRFQPGVTIQRHKHTSEVFAFTLTGSWKYFEYPEVNTAGSYLYEPAGSIHTLPATNTEVTDVWFAIRRANLTTRMRIRRFLEVFAARNFNGDIKTAERAYAEIVPEHARFLDGQD